MRALPYAVGGRSSHPPNALVASLTRPGGAQGGHADAAADVRAQTRQRALAPEREQLHLRNDAFYIAGFPSAVAGEDDRGIHTRNAEISRKRKFMSCNIGRVPLHLSSFPQNNAPFGTRDNNANHWK